MSEKQAHHGFPMAMVVPLSCRECHDLCLLRFVDKVDIAYWLLVVLHQLHKTFVHGVLKPF